MNLEALEKSITPDTACVLIQSPNFFGTIEDVAAIAEIAHKKGAMLVVSIAEAVSLGIVEPPRQADVIAMEAQSFGVPLGFGGPYCGVIATREKYVRQMPGRLAGQTTDRNGKRGFVLTLATREQHIRREKATSNICTNQALVALMVNIFMTIYGKVGLKELAKQNLAKTAYAAGQFSKHARVLFPGSPRFNEFVVRTSEDPVCHQWPPAGTQHRRRTSAEKVLSRAGQCCLVVLYRTDHAQRHRYRGRAGRGERALGQGRRGRSRCAGGGAVKHMTRKATRHVNQNEGLIFEKSSRERRPGSCPRSMFRKWTHPRCSGRPKEKTWATCPEVSEIEIIRHFTRLSTWNYAIDLGMYPLGSCTMKYNPRVNELVVRLDGLANGHPYQPERISQGALRIIKTLSECLTEITGMDAITLQPAAGAHGELTGLLMVRAYHGSQGAPRKKILIPDSAHGTNPATAAMVGYAVENLKSNAQGMVDVAALAAQMNEDVAALMLTNPNTLGVFEQEIHKIAEIMHAKGGLLYMDGANMNALVGKVRPGDFGVDVMHLNLHKTFSTPHGGGGPGSGPVAVKQNARTIPAHASRRSPSPTARSPSNMTGRNRWAGCARFMAISGCSSAPWLTFSRMAPTACAKPPKMPCSMPTTFVKGWKAHTICPTPRPACTRWFSAINCRPKKA